MFYNPTNANKREIHKSKLPAEQTGEQNWITRTSSVQNRTSQHSLLTKCQNIYSPYEIFPCCPFALHFLLPVAERLLCSSGNILLLVGVLNLKGVYYAMQWTKSFIVSIILFIVILITVIIILVTSITNIIVIIIIIVSFYGGSGAFSNLRCQTFIMFLRLT